MPRLERLKAQVLNRLRARIIHWIA
ncbi:MAG: hypothetical protein QOE57_3167, partial [Acidimicrobiaceae bacterium]|nr:hypothetical protein [Acidimicrobiaceae bacterium]